jgi:hypothetical protein
MAASAPDAPGPPGLIIREPMRSVWVPLTTLTRNSGSVAPCGSS